MAEKKSKNKPHNIFSITIRPFPEHLPRVNALIDWCSRNMDEWIVSKEMGEDKENGHHFQVGGYVEKAKRIDGVKGSLQKILNMTMWSEDEKHVGLKIKNHHDWNGLIGYCAKEGNIQGYFPHTIDVKKCLEYYQTKKKEFAEKAEKHEYKYFSINQIGEYLTDIFKEAKHTLSEYEVMEALTTIGNRITLSTWHRLNLEKTVVFLNLRRGCLQKISKHLDNEQRIILLERMKNTLEDEMKILPGGVRGGDITK